MTKTNINASTLEIAENLIARESITPLDAGCQAYMTEYLAHLNFTTEVMDFEDTQNIWSTHGQNESGPVFVFSGHTDVVPAGNLNHWTTPPFTPSIKNGVLYGRGAADMKGSLAAMMTATKQFINDYPTHKGTLAFLITSDEEGPFINGTVKVIETLKKRQQAIDYCIVGEPSSHKILGDVIKIGRRGSLTCWITFNGKQGHVAYPHLANNAIHNMSQFITELLEIEWDHGNQYFPPTSLQITHVNAGEAGNIIPGEAKVEFNLRYSTEQTEQKLKSKIEKLAYLYCENGEIKWKLNGEPFLTQSQQLIDAVTSAIKSVMGITTKPETTGGTSDGRFIAKTGAQIVELGPINRTIHQVNECVNIDELEQLSKIYYQTLKMLLT